MSEVSEVSEPEPERECGTCALCCKVMAVPDLAKPAGKWCVHCHPGNLQGGCSIHDQPRPKICGDYRCTWLMGALAPELKPNLVHAVISWSETGWVCVYVDPGYPDAARVGVLGRTLDNLAVRVPVLIVVGNKRTVLARGPEAKAKLDAIMRLGELDPANVSIQEHNT